MKPSAADESAKQKTSKNEIQNEPLIEQRHHKIQKRILSKGFITNEQLAREFSVTPQTIRRDINKLCKAGLVQRFHGGAGITANAKNVAHTDRKTMCFEEKRKIALMVAGQIPDHASLFINIGTTTEAVAQALENHKRLRIITNNLNVASILSQKDDFEIIVAGGVVRPRDRGIVGEAAIDFIRQFKVDFGVIGISGIDMDGSLLDSDYREVRAARAVIDNSRKIFLAADHTKFGRNAMVRLGDISEMDALFTDRQPPAPLIELADQAEVAVFVASLEKNGTESP